MMVGRRRSRKDSWVASTSALVLAATDDPPQRQAIFGLGTMRQEEALAADEGHCHCSNLQKRVKHVHTTAVITPMSCLTSTASFTSGGAHTSRHVPTRPRSSGLAHRMPWPAWQHAQPVRAAATTLASPASAVSAAAATYARCAVPATTAIAAACAAASASAAAAAAVASAACCLPLSTLCRHVLRKGVLQRRSSGNPDLHRGCHLFGNRTQMGMPSAFLDASSARAFLPSHGLRCQQSLCCLRKRLWMSILACTCRRGRECSTSCSSVHHLRLCLAALAAPPAARAQRRTQSCSRARCLSVRSAVLPHVYEQLHLLALTIS